MGEEQDGRGPGAAGSGELSPAGPGGELRTVADVSTARDADAARVGSARGHADAEASATGTALDQSRARSETGTALDQGRTVAPQQSGAGAAPLGDLAPGAMLLGRYRVVRTLRGHTRSRSGLYITEDADGAARMIKVHRLDYEPYRDALALVAGLDHPNLIKIYELAEADGLLYEVQEYCPHGSLAGLAPPPRQGLTAEHTARVLDELLPQLYAALEAIHRHRLIHRDIKPGNFYLAGPRGTGAGHDAGAGHDVGAEQRGGGTQRVRLVLGDFDSSIILKPGERSRTVAPGGLTPLYIAPERIARVIGGSTIAEAAPASDYYSLGLLLIELLAGTTTLHLLTSGCFLDPASPSRAELDQLEKLIADFYLDSRQLVAIPAGLPDSLATLLKGLLIRRWEHRWSDAEVGRWLVGATTRDDLQLITDHSGHAYKAGQSYKFAASEVESLPELAAAMLEHPREAAKRLTASGALLNWIAQQDADVEARLVEDVARYGGLPEVLAQCAISRCDPQAPLLFPDGRTADSLAQWQDSVSAIASAPDVTGPLGGMPDGVSLEQLAVWLERKAAPEPGLAERVRRVAGQAVYVQWEELHYLLDPARLLAITAETGVPGLLEFAAYAYGKPKDWQAGPPPCYRAALACWSSGRLEAWLRQRGFNELAIGSASLRATLQGEAGFEKLLRAIQPSLPKVKVVPDARSVPRRRSVPYGESRSYAVAYKTEGPGVPYGVVKLAKAVPGVVLGQAGDQLIQAREGAATLEFYATDLPGAGVYQGHLVLDSDTAEFKPAAVPFRFLVAFPHQLTLLRIGLGMLLGLLLFGLPRLTIGLLGENRVFRLDMIDIPAIWHDVVKFQFTTIHLLLCVLVVAVAAFAGFRLWLKALSESEP